MWYFAWILGLGFAVLLAILNALWLENEQGRRDAFGDKLPAKNPADGTVTQGNPAEDIQKTGKPADNEPLSDIKNCPIKNPAITMIAGFFCR